MRAKYLVIDLGKPFYVELKGRRTVRCQYILVKNSLTESVPVEYSNDLRKLKRDYKLLRKDVVRIGKLAHTWYEIV